MATYRIFSPLPPDHCSSSAPLSGEFSGQPEHDWAAAVIFRQTIARWAKKAGCRVVNVFMNKKDIQTIVDAACETADTIVGAREWRTTEDARSMHDVIFWDIITKRLPDVSVADLLSNVD
jgi:hypothetical protein